MATCLASNEDKQKLAFCLDRNVQVGKFAEDASSVDQAVWPEALGAAEQAGRNALFSGLQSVLGSDHVNSATLRRGRKKRKRG